MIRVIRDASGLIFIDGREDPIVGGLRATASSNQIAIANTQGGRPIVCADFSEIADSNGNGFASVAAAMTYLAGVFTPAPREVIEAVAGATFAAGCPLAIDRGSGQLFAAQADIYQLSFVAGLAMQAVQYGFPAQAGRGAVTLADWTSIAGSAALLPGQPYFLAPQGGLTTTPINPGALCVARVGLAASPTTLIANPSSPILL